MSPFLNRFHTSLHKIQLLHQSLLLFYHLFCCMHLFLFMSLHQWVRHYNAACIKACLRFQIRLPYWQKVSTSELVPADSSLVEGPLPRPSAPLSDLDVPITLCKGKQSCIDHLISHFISYDHLNPSFRQFTMSSVSIPRFYEELYWYLPESRLWMRCILLFFEKLRS